MQYSGFQSIHAYEQECARIGHTTQRIPFRKSGVDFFVLVSHPPGSSSTSCSAWSLIDKDETKELSSGVISSLQMLQNGALQDGTDTNYLGKLARQGYFPAEPVDPRTARPEERGKALYLSVPAQHEPPQEPPQPPQPVYSEPTTGNPQLSLFGW